MTGDIDPNSLLFWYPKIRNLDIPMPRTKIVKLTLEEIHEYRCGNGDFFGLSRLANELNRTFVAVTIVPALRP